MVADTWAAAPAVVGAPPDPRVTAVTNAASGNAAIAPNTFTSINGTNLAPAGDSRTWDTERFHYRYADQPRWGQCNGEWNTRLCELHQPDANQYPDAAGPRCTGVR